MGMLFNDLLPWSGGFRHYNSHLRDFERAFARSRVASVNNRFLDVETMGDVRVSRFVRDPRDLVVSGYFYHRRGAEPWTRIEAPTEEDFYFTGGALPESLRGAGPSFAELLQHLPTEEGLLCELEFRGPHLEAMAQWQSQKGAHGEAVIVQRYEDVVGREAEVFGAIFDHFELGPVERRLGLLLARRYSLHGLRGRRDGHVRNPSAGQWREQFTPRVRQEFDRRYGALVRDLGYPES